MSCYLPTQGRDSVYVLNSQGLSCSVVEGGMGFSLRDGQRPSSEAVMLGLPSNVEIL